MAENLNEQVGATTPVETTDRGVFDFKHKDDDGKPIKVETLASEFDEKIQVSDPVEAEYQDELEKKGLKEKLMEKLPEGQNKSDDHHADEAVPVVADPAVKEKEDYKGLLDKINEKFPGGQNKTDDHHDEAVPVVAEPTVEGEEDKKGFMDKIKDKIPGLSSSKASDEKISEEWSSA